MEELEETLKKLNQEIETETDKMIESTKKIEDLKKQKIAIQTILGTLTKSY
jgi:predicted  nucleic acid-binding Zn-ribbon protein